MKIFQAGWAANLGSQAASAILTSALRPPDMSALGAGGHLTV